MKSLSRFQPRHQSVSTVAAGRFNREPGDTSRSAGSGPNGQ
jgi:hypothetical protein